MQTVAFEQVPQLETHAVHDGEATKYPPAHETHIEVELWYQQLASGVPDMQAPDGVM